MQWLHARRPGGLHHRCRRCQSFCWAAGRWDSQTCAGLACLQQGERHRGANTRLQIKPGTRQCAIATARTLPATMLAPCDGGRPMTSCSGCLEFVAQAEPGQLKRAACTANMLLTLLTCCSQCKHTARAANTHNLLHN